ncbi:MAG: rhodanese-like domain-containing protein [Bdellovibrionales bacterium]
MKKIILTVAVLLSSFSFAKDLFKTISISELDLLIKTSPKNIYIFDANVESTRTHVGIIPGAKLIDSSSDYDVASVLPKVKTSALIFYCANKMCTASHQAATRALEAGYTNVSVLKDCIFGWQKAGKKIEAVSRTPQSQTAEAIEPSAADALLKKKEAIIVDVREDEERFEIVTGSSWMPMSKANESQLWDEFKKQLPKNKTIIFYCASGNRSKKIAEKLAAEGVKSLYFKSADQWKAAGLPVSKGPAR